MSFLKYIEEKYSFSRFIEFHTEYFINNIYKKIENSFYKSHASIPPSISNTNIPPIIYMHESDDIKKKEQLVFKFLRERTLSKIKLNKYRFNPFLFKEITDYKGKTRTLHLLDFEDKFVDRIIHDYFQEKLMLKKNKGVHTITKSIQKFISQENRNSNSSPLFGLRLDIKDFFNSINKDILLRDIEKLKDENLFYIIKNFLMTISYEDDPLFEDNSSFDKVFSSSNYIRYNPTIGIPTGSATSHALSDYYLKEIEDDLNIMLSKSNCLFVRYVDDFCVLCDSETVLNNSFKKINSFFIKKHLRFSEKKFQKGEIINGFTFLGFYHNQGEINISNETIKNIKLQIIKSFNYSQLEKKGHRIHLIKLIDKINRLNLGIVGFNKSWKVIVNETKSKANLLSAEKITNNIDSSYGLARYLSISDDFEKIESLEKWIGRFLRYHLIKNGYNTQISNNQFKLESLKNWFYKYKKSEYVTNKKSFLYFIDFYKKYNNRIKEINSLKRTNKKKIRNWKLFQQIKIFYLDILEKSYNNLFKSVGTVNFCNNSEHKTFDDYIMDMNFNELNELLINKGIRNFNLDEIEVESLDENEYMSDAELAVDWGLVDSIYGFSGSLEDYGLG